MSNKQTFKFGVGDESSLTALEAAQRFTDLYLSKDLTSIRVQVPEEKIDNGLSTDVPAGLSESERNAKADEIQDVKDKVAYKKYWSQYQGGASELEIWNYICKIPLSIPLGLFHNFDLRMFRHFTGMFWHTYFIFYN